ncbi:MAG: two-component sensor histidine kinase [Deltaproteobacteria bacterium HGW-Deltaproteobacteria-1]|jgi:heavy metal sensor kinase|nr:MAG: two-component sensor histidine kinase [Deltaproteobacteria bacterium HGW-Deltaproteobacteria-1]
MSSKKFRHFRNSLTFRLTLWYGGIFAVSSFVAFFLFYTLITSVIQQKTDRDLLNQARQFSTVLQEQGILAVESFALFEAKAAGEKKVFFRLLYPTGKAFSSSNMAYWQEIAISKEAIGQLLGDARQVIETIRMTKRKEEVRILYAMIGPGVILQVGQSMENYTRIYDAFREIFFITMALLIGLAIGVGWFMARRAVSGVETITKTAQGISGGTLETRVPVKDRGDEIDQLAMTFNQMLDRIQLLVAEIRQMGDDIAHDLKSPIARIRGMAEIALTTAKTPAEFEAMAASAIEECDRLLEIINTMLMISKTEAGVEKPSRNEIDLADLVREACELFGTTAEDRGVTLSCNLPEQCVIEGDARMIQRLLSNLLDNAVKYTSAGGRVDISLSHSKAQGVILEVKDTGIGISTADLPLIFERFYRGDQSRSESGTGLGLSLARAIARAHGGNIIVESRLHEGSVFTVTLPSSR